MKIRTIHSTAAAYPARLRQLHDPPAQIYVIGPLESALAQPCLAVVGSRKMTAYGKQVTDQLTETVSRRGVTIVSGLAYGVDAQAHQAALQAGGITVAVLASGLDQITPLGNEWLGRKVLEQGGALVSEYPPGTPAMKHSFVARNRLIAALSDAVLIPEAAVNSGSLHTAQYALDLGRSVMAVPGSINSSLSEGANNLIKSGAVPVTSAADITHTLGIGSPAEQARLFGSSHEENKLLVLMSEGTTDAKQLLELSQLEPSVFNQTLTMLEITGRIYALGGGHWGLR